MTSKIIVEEVKVDYILVGQGLAGSWLAYEMLERGLSIALFDEGKEQTSSRRAAGIYNPITGRKMVKTWLADLLFDQLEHEYEKLELKLSSNFLHRIPIYRPFKTIEDLNDWEGKMDDTSFENYLIEMRTSSIGYDQMIDPYGGIILNRSGYVNIPLFLDEMKNLFQQKNVYQKHMFDYDGMIVEEDQVKYKKWTANKLIFCEGSLSKNPFWNLPFRPVRGEIIDIKCNLEAKYIINQGVFMIPKNGKYTVGSTYDHNNLTYEPQETGITSLEERLQKLFSGEYEIIDKRAGVRPATHDRKPYIGIHPKNKTLAIFNGFGTKRCFFNTTFLEAFC